MGYSYTKKKSSASRQAHHGFTLVELLIVIIIIAILAAITVVVYNGVAKKAVEASMRSDLEAARDSIALLKAGHKNYPADTSGANNGQGLKTSPGNQLIYGSSGTTYCVQVSNPKTSAEFYLMDGSIKDGSCNLVSTIAGNINIWTSADGTGSGASFDWPMAGAIGPDGNLYVGDCGSAVRKVTPAGVVTTFAGLNETYGYVDGPVATARFSCIQGIAVASDGTVYTAEYNSNGGFYGIRKISGGTVTTLAGNGTRGYVDGTGTAAEFSDPYGLAIDSLGNIYVADHACTSTWDSTTASWQYTCTFTGIRKVTPSGVVTTFAGSSTIGTADGTGAAAQFSHFVRGITIDKNDNLYVADSSNNRIRKITPAGVVTTVAGSTQGNKDGTGTAAQFDFPTGITIDQDGNLYVADEDNNTIRKITPGGVVTTLAGDGTYGYADGAGVGAQFGSVENGIAVDKTGTVYVIDSGNGLVRKIIQ